MEITSEVTKEMICDRNALINFPILKKEVLNSDYKRIDNLFEKLDSCQKKIMGE